MNYGPYSTFYFQMFLAILKLLISGSPVKKKTRTQSFSNFTVFYVLSCSGG
jgi:hypothetical protein